MSTLADRIREAFGTSKPSAIARATGKSAATVTQWLDGTIKSLKADTAAKMEEKTGYRASWLVTGLGAKRLDAGNVFDALTDQELELLRNYRILADEDQQILFQDIANKAAKTRAHLEKILGTLGLRTVATVDLDQLGRNQLVTNGREGGLSVKVLIRGPPGPLNCLQG